MTGSIISGQTIARTGRYRIFPIVGTVLLVVAMTLFHFVSATTPLWHVMAVMVIFGLGLGGNMQPVVLAVQNAVAPREIGVATSSVTFSRQMGGTLGAAIFLSILFSTVTGYISDAVKSASRTAAWHAAMAAHPGQLEQLKSGGSQVLSDTSFIQRLDPALAAPFKTGFADAMDLVFLVTGIVVLVSLFVVWRLPELPLRMESASAARAAEDAEDADLMGIPSAVAPEAVAPGTTPARR